MILQLTKQSTDKEIKAYFEEVLRMSRDNAEFPVNLDDVWPLVFGRKEEAVRALKNDRLFVENIDYQVLRKNAENPDSFTQRSAKPQGGRPTNIYMLSVPCLEFFIARKVRPVFEVYRQVFHKVASGEIVHPVPIYSKPCDLETSLRPLRDYTDEIYQRWKRLFDLLNGSDRVKKEYNNWITTYENLCYYTSQMVYLETMEKLEGNQFIK